MIRFIPLLLFALLCFSVSCRRAAVPTAAASAQQEVKQVPKIIFVNLEISDDSLTQTKAVTLVNSIVTEGKLKNRAAEIEDDRPGDLQCTFLSANGQQLHVISVPNPLERTYEYASEDGKLQKRTIKLHKATVSLRAPLEPGTTQLLVQQIQDNHQLKNLQILNLSL